MYSVLTKCSRVAVASESRRDMAHRLKRFVLIRDSDHASRVSISTVAAIKMEAGGWGL